jgi:hypothetical protein
VYWGSTVPRQPLGAWLRACLGVSAWCSGASYVATLVADERSAAVVSVLVALVAGVFGAGVDPRLPELPRAARPVLGLSYSRWATQALVLGEATRHDPLRARGLLDRLGLCPGPGASDSGADAEALLDLALGGDDGLRCDKDESAAWWALAAGALLLRAAAAIAATAKQPRRPPRR